MKSCTGRCALLAVGIIFVSSRKWSSILTFSDLQDSITLQIFRRQTLFLYNIEIKSSIPRPLNIVLPLSRLSIAQTSLVLPSLLHRFYYRMRSLRLSKRKVMFALTFPSVSRLDLCQGCLPVSGFERSFPRLVLSPYSFLFDLLYHQYNIDIYGINNSNFTAILILHINPLTFDLRLALL